MFGIHAIAGKQANFEEFRIRVDQVRYPFAGCEFAFFVLIIQFFLSAA
jgi:hypothetical protein